MAVLWCNSSVN